LSFDGVDDYVNAGNKSNLDVDASDFTIGGWVNPEATELLQAIFGKLRFSTDSWGIYQSVTNKFSAQYRGSGSGCLIASDDVFIPGQWYHIVGVRSGTNLSLYINGVKQNSTCSTADIASTSSYNFIIGKRTNSNDYYFNGSIDDIKFYNYARTEEQIRMDYQQGVATHLK